MVSICSRQAGTIAVSDINAVIEPGSSGITATTSGGVIDIQNAGNTIGSVPGIAATTSGDGTFGILVGGETTGAQNRIDFNFDAAINDFLVAIELEDRVFENTKIAEAAQALWYRSADAWADHRASARFGGSDASPAWAVAYGSVAQRDEQFADPTEFGLADTNLDYEQDFFGFQGGADYKIGDSPALSVTGGYLSSSFR